MLMYGAMLQVFKVNILNAPDELLTVPRIGQRYIVARHEEYLVE